MKRWKLFHLLFLSQLGTKLDKKLYTVLCGGAGRALHTKIEFTAC